MLGGLRAGPKSRYFGMAIIGERGVGKTVLLNEIERQAKSSLGWQYIQEQCSSGPDWIGTLIERVIETASPWWRMRRVFKEMDKQYSAGANLGVLSAQATATRKGDQDPTGAGTRAPLDDAG